MKTIITLFAACAVLAGCGQSGETTAIEKPHATAAAASRNLTSVYIALRR